MAAQMRESAIPRETDRASYTTKAVGFVVKNHAQLAIGSKPERAAALGSGKIQFGPRVPTGVPELVDLEDALVFLRVMKPKLAEAVDVFIECNSDMGKASRKLRRPYRTVWGWLGEAYIFLSEIM